MLCVFWMQITMDTHNVLTFVLLYLSSFFESHREDYIHVNCATLLK